jgi:hypothetical protein
MIIRLTSGQRLTLQWTAGISVLFTLTSLMVGQGQTAIAWWLMLACLLPALLWGQRSQFLSVKIFVWVAFISQAVTMPLFYFNQEAYGFHSHRHFGFTGLESLHVFVRLGVFLLIFLIVVAFLERVIKLPLSIASIKSRPAMQVKVNQKTSLLSTTLILFIIMIMTPLNDWMFQMGIGITGVQPPKLPYHMSGILHYLVKWIVPALLAVLYFRTNQRSLILIVILGFYSMYLGLSTSSRSAVLAILFIPIVLSLVHRRWLLFTIALMLCLISIGLTSASRAFVHLASEGVTSADTSLGILGVFIEAMGIFEWTELWRVLPSVVGRMTSFEGLFFASQVDPSSFGGGFAVWLKTLHWGLVDLGHEAVHLEVVGYVPPVGFYNATADLYAYVFWGGNGSIVYYLVFALSAALFLMLQEQAVGKVASRYGFIGMPITGLVFLLSIFYIVAVGSPMFVGLFFVILIFSRLPKIVRI